MLPPAIYPVGSGRGCERRLRRRGWPVRPVFYRHARLQRHAHGDLQLAGDAVAHSPRLYVGSGARGEPLWHWQCAVWDTARPPHVGMGTWVWVQPTVRSPTETTDRSPPHPPNLPSSPHHAELNPANPGISCRLWEAASLLFTIRASSADGVNANRPGGHIDSGRWGEGEQPTGEKLFRLGWGESSPLRTGARLWSWSGSVRRRSWFGRRRDPSGPSPWRLQWPNALFWGTVPVSS